MLQRIAAIRQRIKATANSHGGAMTEAQYLGAGRFDSLDTAHQAANALRQKARATAQRETSSKQAWDLILVAPIAIY